MNTVKKVQWLEWSLIIVGILSLLVIRHGDSMSTGWYYAKVLTTLDVIAIIICTWIAKRFFSLHVQPIALILLYIILFEGISELHGWVFRYWVMHSGQKEYNAQCYEVMLSTAYRLWNSHFVILCGVLASLLYYFFQRSIQHTFQIHALQKEKADAEIKFLKAQANPHFLFNSLNSIYGLIDKENALARNTVHTFSELLRYQLYECNVPEIEIQKEFSFLRSYIEMQKLRLGPKITVTYQLEDACHEKTIAPLLLIPFVDNAFKYVSHHDQQENFIDIQVRCSNAQFQFECSNTYEKQRNSPLEGKVGGIGILNVQRRLELIYGDRHHMHIKDDGKIFTVHLEISLEKQTA